MGMYWELIPKTIVVAYLGQLVGTLVSQPTFAPARRRCHSHWCCNGTHNALYTYM